jgi:predicted nucleotidyltransferase
VDRVVAGYREALGSDLLAVACFGSVARGEATPESDLDLYIVTREEAASLIDPRLTLAGRLDETPEYAALTREGFRPDPMPIFHSATKLETHPWILLDIADHGVILYDPKGILAKELDLVRHRLRSWAASASSFPTEAGIESEAGLASGRDGRTVTNRERADQLLAEATGIAEDMRRALERGGWNLATRRAQEVIELVVKGLLNEMGVSIRGRTILRRLSWKRFGAAR